MKNIYTSNFARNGENPNAYGISSRMPEWYSGKTLDILAPTTQMVIDYKKGRISEEEYTKRYLAHITREGRSAESLYEDIPDNAILLCYESPGEFCHRRVFAEWIKLKLEIEIPEMLNQTEQNNLEREKLVESLVNF